MVCGVWALWRWCGVGVALVQQCHASWCSSVTLNTPSDPHLPPTQSPPKSSRATQTRPPPSIPHRLEQAHRLFDDGRQVGQPPQITPLILPGLRLSRGGGQARSCQLSGQPLLDVGVCGQQAQGPGDGVAGGLKALALGGGGGWVVVVVEWDRLAGTGGRGVGRAGVAGCPSLYLRTRPP